MSHYKRLRYVKNVGVNCVLILHLCLELTKKIIKHLLHFMIRIVGIGNNMFEYGMFLVCLRISVDKDWSLLARFIFFVQTCLLNGVSPLYRAQLIEPVRPQSENSGDNNTSSVNTRIGPSNLCRVS